MSATIAVPAPPPWAPELLTVGVTGTNGKSTTTTWVAAALGAMGTRVVRATTLGFFVDDEEQHVEKSYEGFIECMRRGHGSGARYAAIELTSEALARGFAKAWPCKVGVFTNLSHDHLDAHGSPEHYLASKAQLFVSLAPGATAVLNARDESSALLAEILAPGVGVVTYGVPSRGAACLDEDASATAVELGWDGTRITCIMHGAPVELRVRAIGEVHAENALAAWLAAEAAGVSRADALARLAAAPPPPGRFEVVKREPYVVVDYAHTPDALGRTVATAKALAAQRSGARVHVVFGAGGKRDKAKRGPMGTSASAADVVTLTSDNPRDEDPAAICDAIREGLGGHGGVRTILDRGEAIREAVLAAGRDDVVLLAGMGHEREQTIGNQRFRFSDVDEAKKAYGERG